MSYKSNFTDLQRESFNEIAENSNSNIYEKNKALNFEYSTIINNLDNLNNSNVLDYGCGVGRYSIELSKTAKLVYSVDISDVSLKKLDEECKRKDIKNIKISKLESFSFDKYVNYFDYIFLINVCHHVDELEELLSSLKDILKENGRIIIFEFNPLNLTWIPFLVVNKEIKAHFNRYYFRSNIFSLKHFFKKVNYKIENIEKYAFLPTSLYNISNIFISMNKILNKIPVINIFSAFNIITLKK